jgi:hypothetical protein
LVEELIVTDFDDVVEDLLSVLRHHLALFSGLGDLLELLVPYKIADGFEDANFTLLGLRLLRLEELGFRLVIIDEDLATGHTSLSWTLS